MSMHEIKLLFQLILFMVYLNKLLHKVKEAN